MLTLESINTKLGELTDTSADDTLLGRLSAIEAASGGGGGLTDEELRASAVPVSVATVPSHAVTNAGTFAVQPGTAVTGPGNPVIDSYGSIPINLAAGANQVLVSSAANKQIWVYGLAITVNEAGTVSFQDEDDVAKSGIMPLTTGISFPSSGNFAMPMWKLDTDKDLEIDIVTSEVDGWLTYAIVSV